MAQSCMPSADFDPFDPAQVATLSTTPTCKDGCSDKLADWLDSSAGWGCCTASLLDGFEAVDELKKFPEHLKKLITACDQTNNDKCLVPDGGEVQGTFSVSNIADSWYNGQSDAAKADTLKKIEEDVGKAVGIDKTAVTVTATAAAGVLTAEVTIAASGSSQGGKVINQLNKFDSSRRQGGRMKRLGMKSLTSNPSARRDAKLPVTASTSNVVTVYKVVPKDTPHAVVITVTMPYTKDEFDEDKQTKFKKAVAKVAGTTEKNIVLTIKDSRRRAGSIQVETKILAGSPQRLAEIKSTLGSDTAKLLEKLNTELKAQGLEAATGVTAPEDAKPALSAAERKYGERAVRSVWGLAVASLVLILGFTA